MIFWDRLEVKNKHKTRFGCWWLEDFDQESALIPIGCLLTAAHTVTPEGLN